VFRDLDHADVFREMFLVASQAEHLRQHERFTRGDGEVEAHVLRIPASLRSDTKVSSIPSSDRSRVRRLISWDAEIIHVLEWTRRRLSIAAPVVGRRHT
jgi:transmembrane secretion effector